MSKSIIATAVAALIFGSGAGYFMALNRLTESSIEQSNSAERKVIFYRNPMNPTITSPQPAKDEMGMDYVPVYAQDEQTRERKVLFYRNPMNPSITSPVPAKDEMGMDYVPVYPDDNSAGNNPAGTVTINSSVEQNIGVRTAEVTRETLARSVRTIGRVTYDEQRIARLHPKYDGWVEKLFINKVGESVEKGSVLLSIYSPQLVATQEEYLLALNSIDILGESPFGDVREGAVSLLRSSRERLQLLDVPEHQINQIKSQRKIMKGMHIHSPFNGIVMSIGAREGERISPETELYMIADLARVWVLVDIYEDDIPWVREGDTAKMQVAGIPGRTFTGKVSFIYPYLDPKTRTIKVRLEFDNPNLDLKPDMFADVDIEADKQIEAVVVPSESIVRTGTQEQVFVQRAAGQFAPRQVTVGVSVDGKTQIISGLKDGEIIVTSSQFLLDSESKLKEATAKMLEVTNPNPASTSEGQDVERMQLVPANMENHQPNTSKTDMSSHQGMSGMDMGDAE
jgi:Cu(I)/Ag(I) efflux system membrane fusion protein